MKVTLLSHTPNPEKTIACAAKLCYSSTSIGELYDGLTQEKSADFVEMLCSIGHESPIEHVTFTFGIEDVSRAFLAQITRHRIASFSVQSQRYVKENNFTFITPPEIKQSNTANILFEEAMTNAISSYNQLADILAKKHFDSLIAIGKDEKTAKNLAEKTAIEDARFVLPNACSTQMIVTMNARSLLNFFKLRCCNRAQWEIKSVADSMLKLVSKIAPTLFVNAGPSCYHGNCSEGSKSCGQAGIVREFYKNLHKEKSYE